MFPLIKVVRTITIKMSEQTLKELRTQSSKTQKEFSDMFGIPLRTYQNWEMYEADPNKTNGRKPPEYVKNMIATILGMDKGK